MSDHKYTSAHPRDGGRFTKGSSGSPGRPRKSVSCSALALDEIGARPANRSFAPSLIDAQVRGIMAFDHEQRLYELEKKKPEPFRPPHER
jgi:hypothetical protein